MARLFPVGPIFLVILLILVATGFLEPILHRLGLTPRLAALFIASFLLFSLIQVEVLPGLVLNAGTGLLPLLLAGYLTWSAEEGWLRVLAAAGLTGAVLYLVRRWLPPGVFAELSLFYLDVQYLFALVGGLVAFMGAQSPRGALAAGLIGTVLADLLHYLSRVQGPAVLVGGGGFFATALIAGSLAAALSYRGRAKA